MNARSEFEREHLFLDEFQGSRCPVIMLNADEVQPRGKASNRYRRPPLGNITTQPDFPGYIGYDVAEPVFLISQFEIQYVIRRAGENAHCKTRPPYRYDM